MGVQEAEPRMADWNEGSEPTMSQSREPGPRRSGMNADRFWSEKSSNSDAELSAFYTIPVWGGATKEWASTFWILLFFSFLLLLRWCKSSRTGALPKLNPANSVPLSRRDGAGPGSFVADETSRFENSFNESYSYRRADVGF